MTDTPISQTRDIPAEIRQLIVLILTDPKAAIEYADHNIPDPIYYSYDLAKAVGNFNPKYADDIVRDLPLLFIEVFEKLLPPPPPELDSLTKVQVLRTLVQAEPALAIKYANAMNDFDEFITTVANWDPSRA
jgi:hypothetical protein